MLIVISDQTLEDAMEILFQSDFDLPVVVGEIEPETTPIFWLHEDM